MTAAQEAFLSGYAGIVSFRLKTVLQTEPQLWRVNYDRLFR